MYMNQYLAIKISETGGGGRGNPDVFGNELCEVFKGADIYYHQPQPGKIIADATGWIIISHIADLAGIASALWVLYEKVINRTKNNKSIYIDIDSGMGAHWLIGKTIKDKDAFLEEFIEKVSVLNEGGRIEIIFERTVAKVKHDNSWVKKNEET